MDKEEFLKFMKSFAPDNEMCDVTFGVVEHPQAMEELVEFARQNNLNCIHLFQDEYEDNVQAGRDWNRFNEKIIELEDKYDLYEEIDD